MATAHRHITREKNKHTSTKMLMNDDAQLFKDNNNITRRDAIECLKEYGSKLNWKSTGARIFEIGSADGSVTSLLAKYIPNDYKQLIGCDINEKMVNFANEHYGNERLKFMVLNIEDDLPKELRERFDHVFSFCTFQWIRNQEKGFTNIYDLLSAGGECLMTILGQSSMYTIFDSLSRTTKWGPWLADCDQFLSPYHDYHQPDNKIQAILHKIGFHNIDVRCKQKMFNFELDTFKNVVTCINPFKIPIDIFQEFLNDYTEVARDMRMVDENSDTVKFNYNIFIVHCEK